MLTQNIKVIIKFNILAIQGIKNSDLRKKRETVEKVRHKLKHMLRSKTKK